jgi:serine/threonine-protein kinase RsbW
MPAPLPEPDQPLGPFEYRFAPTLTSVRLARHVFANWVELLPGVVVDAIDDLLIACSELVTNAVRHGDGTSATVVLRGAVDGNAVILEVENGGDGFVWPVTHGIEDVVVHEENGRGLFIVEALTDEMQVMTSEGRTVVRCVKHAMLRQQETSEDPALSARFRAESHPGDANTARR